MQSWHLLGAGPEARRNMHILIQVKGNGKKQEGRKKEGKRVAPEGAKVGSERRGWGENPEIFSGSLRSPGRL